MEDRYLFRGKRIDTGEWIVGSLLVDKQQDIDTGEQIEITGIYPSEYKDFAKKIDTTTICQCTGRKDKNGKLIWENDILSGHIDVEFPEDETRKCVVWHENGWCTNEPGCDYSEELDDFDSENFEVIGNMIDNPELLEVRL
jgi:uncharacterized phage protein (TIGR01671 family)